MPITGPDILLYEKHDKVVVITLNRPEKLNAWSPRMHLELADVFTAVGSDDEVRVIVLTGAGRAICAGADIKEGFQAGIEKRKKAGARREEDSAYGPRGSFSALAALEKPVIAAINGYAIGIGCTVTLACDIRIASAEAKFSLPFARLGIIPEFGST